MVFITLQSLARNQSLWCAIDNDFDITRSKPGLGSKEQAVGVQKVISASVGALICDRVQSSKSALDMLIFLVQELVAVVAASIERLIPVMDTLEPPLGFNIDSV